MCSENNIYWPVDTVFLGPTFRLLIFRDEPCHMDTLGDATVLADYALMTMTMTMTRLKPRLHDRANIELARRAMVISMLIRRAGGL